MLKSLQIGTAFRLVTQTMPILAVRLAAYLVFWVVALAYFGVVVGLAWLLGQIAGFLSWIVLILGLVGFGPLYNLAYRYFFYLLKAAHLSVMAELLVSGGLPKNANQLAWGKEQVARRFGEVSVMFVVDQLVHGVVRAFTGTVAGLLRFIPGDVGRGLAQIVERTVRYATNYMDEAIMARAFWRQEQSIWESAEEGLVLYAQAWKPLLKNAVALMLLSFVPFGLLLLIVVIPVALIIGLTGAANLAAWIALSLLALAFLVKVAVGDTLAMAAMVAAYYHETDQMTADPEMVARLGALSDKFRQIKEKAVAAMPRTPDAAGEPLLKEKSPEDLGLPPSV